MKVSLNWVYDYLSKKIDSDFVVESLTNTGLEVEGREVLGSSKKRLKGLLVGELVTINKHPNADKLRLTTVDAGGKEYFNIVCGAPNLEIGQKVVVAPVGTSLYIGGEELKIKKAKIRGEVSEGMLCSEKEIEIGEDSKGIISLPKSLKNGMLLEDYFNPNTDELLEIGLTPNRTDAMGHFGVARDFIASCLIHDSLKVSLVLPKINSYELSKGSSTGRINVVVNATDLCPRYSGVLLENVKVSPSPDWLSKRLLAIGIKPKNNLVDITNFVLHELGQPLHAFDADKIKDNKILVRKGLKKENFKTLNEEEKTLVATDLVIADSSTSMCLAGVIGGKNSAVDTSTTSVFLESAYFDSSTIRRTAKYHKLSTDASYRYERGTDPNQTLQVLFRAIDILKQEIPRLKVHPVVDIYPTKITPVELSLNKENIAKVFGGVINETIIEKILKGLDISYKKNGSDGWQVKIPTYRRDVIREIDVIEELMRIYGFNNIPPSKAISIPLTFTKASEFFDFKDKVRNILSNVGFSEIINNSITSPEENQKDNYVQLLNPLSTLHTVLRKDLITQGLATVAYNMKHNQNDLCFYEIGKKYAKKANQITENTSLALFIAGNIEDQNWLAVERGAVNFYTIKSIVNYLFEKLLGADFSIKSVAAQQQFLDYGLSYLSSNNSSLATFGSVSTDLKTKNQISLNVMAADINLEALFKSYKPLKSTTYKQVILFPSIRRDLSFLIDETTNYQDIEDSCYSHGGKLLKKVDLFDVYKGKEILAEKKSYAISLVFQDKDRTLKDAQVDKIMSKIIDDLKQNYKAVLR